MKTKDLDNLTHGDIVVFIKPINGWAFNKYKIGDQYKFHSFNIISPILRKFTEVETITIRKISIMTDKEKKLRQHKKELKSLRNKMGKHIVWFDALASNRQYDLLFLWKKEKYKTNDVEVPTKVKYEYGNRHRLQMTYTKYPASIKHFLEVYTLDSRFQPSKVRIREASLNLLLK